MANIKQQVKRNKTNHKRNLLNASTKSAMRTAMKNVLKAVENKDINGATLALNIANKRLDKALTKGIIHKNYVARQKSSLSLAVNTLAK